MVLHVEEDCFTLPLQVNLETPPAGASRVRLREQSVATFFGYQREHEIFVIRRIAGKVNARGQPLQ